MYAGLSPVRRARDLLRSSPTWTPWPGSSSPRAACTPCPQALAAAAREARRRHPLRHRGRRASRRRGDRAVAVHTADGERIACDAVVLNPDLPGGRARPARRRAGRVRRLRYSPSCFLLLAGSSAGYSKIAHHNIHFGRVVARGVSTSSIDRGRLMTDPSFLVTNPTRSDPVARPGRQARSTTCSSRPRTSTRASTGSGERAPLPRRGARSGSRRAATSGSATPSRWSTSTTPLDWDARGMERGRAVRVRPLVPADRALPARATCGARTSCSPGRAPSPGSACPMVLISGRLAAERITGPDPRYRSRARR